MNLPSGVMVKVGMGCCSAVGVVLDITGRWRVLLLDMAGRCRRVLLLDITGRWRVLMLEMAGRCRVLLLDRWWLVLLLDRWWLVLLPSSSPSNSSSSSKDLRPVRAGSTDTTGRKPKQSK